MAITRYLNENYGSLISIDIAPAWQISTFTPTPGINKIPAGNIVFNAGYDWQNIYCSQDTMGHQQTQLYDANGQPWQHTIVGFIPGDEDQIEAGLLPLTQQRYVVRITRPNGLIKIVGTPQQPLDLKIDSNSQSTVPGTAGSALIFTGLTLKRALIVI